MVHYTSVRCRTDLDLNNNIEISVIVIKFALSSEYRNQIKAQCSSKWHRTSHFCEKSAFLLSIGSRR